MATVPASQSIKPEDFKSEDQEMVGQIAQPFNSFTEQMVETINNDLTFGENFRGETRTFTFTSDSDEVTFRYNGKGVPAHIWITRVSNIPGSALMPYWSQDGKGNITVKIIGMLTADIDYNITFIIVSE